MATQLITPNPGIPCRPGYCLEYVRETFSLPIRYGSATEAWEKSTSQHRDMNFPAGLWVPIYFAIDIEPNGHIALLAPDGSVFSSSDLTNVPHHHPSIDDLIAYYARWGKMQLTYLGWSEDVAGFPVVSVDGSINFQSVPTPTQEEPMPIPTLDEIRHSLYEILQDPVVIEAQRKGIVNDATLTNIQGTLKPTLDGHAQNLWDGLQNIPAQVLNQQFKLTDGTVTNLAGILSAINAKPVAGPVTVNTDPAAIEAAILSVTRNQWNK